MLVADINRANSAAESLVLEIAASETEKFPRQNGKAPVVDGEAPMFYGVE